MQGMDIYRKEVRQVSTQKIEIIQPCTAQVAGRPSMQSDPTTDACALNYHTSCYTLTKTCLKTCLKNLL